MDVQFEHFVRFTLKGKKGQVLSVSAKPQTMFRGESMLATDDFSQRGYSTRVISVAVYTCEIHLNKLSAAFSLGGVCLPTCDKDSFITVKVEFLEDCTWCASIKGMAAADGEVRARLQAQNMLAGVSPAPKGNMLTAEEIAKYAEAPSIPGAAEQFALVYAGCEAEAIFVTTHTPFRGIVQGFDDKGRIVLGALGSRERTRADYGDITWTVDSPVTGWHICAVEGAKVSSVGKECAARSNHGAYSACARPLGHVGDHVSVGLGTLRFSERWPQAQPEVLYRGEMMETEAPKRRFCGYCHKASPTLVCQRKYGHKDQHIRHDRCGNGSATSCFGPKGHEGPCEWATWKGDDRETTPVTVDLSPVTPVVLPPPTQRLLQMVCGLPPRCLTRPQREELRLLERQLQCALHLKDTLEYKKQHQLQRRVEGETANEQFTRFTAAADVAAWTAVLGEGMKKEPSLADLAARLFALAGQVSHEFLSVKQSRELNEAIRKLRSVLVL